MDKGANEFSKILVDQASPEGSCIRVKADKEKFPITVKRGSSQVKIYRDQRQTGIYYRVVYYLGGKRKRLVFSSVNNARAEAEAKASQLARGDVDAAQITSHDRLIYGRALEASLALRFAWPADAFAGTCRRWLLLAGLA